MKRNWVDLLSRKIWPPLVRWSRTSRVSHKLKIDTKAVNSQPTSLSFLARAKSASLPGWLPVLRCDFTSVPAGSALGQQSLDINLRILGTRLGRGSVHEVAHTGSLGSQSNFKERRLPSNKAENILSQGLIDLCRKDGVVLGQAH
jgi:hypothetical protein